MATTNPWPTTVVQTEFSRAVAWYGTPDPLLFHLNFCSLVVPVAQPDSTYVCELLVSRPEYSPTSQPGLDTAAPDQARRLASPSAFLKQFHLAHYIASPKTARGEEATDSCHLVLVPALFIVWMFQTWRPRLQPRRRAHVPCGAILYTKRCVLSDSLSH